MAKLNQIIAARNGKKTRVERTFTEIYRKLKVADLFHGISKTYEPLDDDPTTFSGETFPPEKKNVQVHVKDLANEAAEALSELFDITATQDYANCEAKATIKVDNQPILENVPTTYLLFLEKQLTELYSFVSKWPTLDAAEDWTWNAQADAYATSVKKRNKSKKIPKTITLAEATADHPAQAEVIHEDVKVGEWNQIDFSGAVKLQTKNGVLTRIRKLQDAVKFAREEANLFTITDQQVGEPIFQYIFGQIETN